MPSDIRSLARIVLSFLVFEFLFGIAAFIVTPNGVVSARVVSPLERAEYILVFGALGLLCLAGVIALGRKRGKGDRATRTRRRYRGGPRRADCLTSRSSGPSCAGPLRLIVGPSR
jgi:hypothetical protein